MCDALPSLASTHQHLLREFGEKLGTFSPDAAVMVLTGLIPIAGTVVKLLAAQKGVSPEIILQGIAKRLA